MPTPSASMSGGDMARNEPSPPAALAFMSGTLPFAQNERRSIAEMDGSERRSWSGVTRGMPVTFEVAAWKESK